MARLLHHMSPLVAPAAISLLLLIAAALTPSAATAAAEDAPVKKVGMRFRQANKEEAQWLDRYAATHQPLGAGPLRMVRATPEQERWLNRLSSDTATATDDGEDGGAGTGSGGGGGSIDFDEDNPYVHALRAWVSRLIKQSLEKGGQVENNLFQDL